MIVYTFIVERAGGTYCSQHSGTDFGEAAQGFADYAATLEHLDAASKDQEGLVSDLLEAVELDGLTNVFCVSHLDKDDEIWLVNIVQTDVSKPQGGLQ